MADYTTITDTQVDPDAPLTSGLAYAWRDNPIAIAEGAAGAPRVVPFAINNWLAKVELTAATTPVVVTGLNSGTFITAIGGFQNGSADSSTLQISGSIDGGASWGSWVTLTGNASNTRYGCSMVINLDDGYFVSALSASGTLGSGPFDAIRFRHSVALVGSGNAPAVIAVYSLGRSP